MRHLLAFSILFALGGPACRRRDPAVVPVASRLPGAPPLPASVDARLRAALAALGPGYLPHTRHRDGNTPRFINRLILESSPYLLQHAHNPVDWYAWGEEAFAAARASGKPILLSVGYSTCHWCHVMERESFEDLEIARYLNQHYLCIKVDREQRPDLDALYLRAVERLSGSGGWPMTVWLTPSGEPFFGGTYFPARDGDRGAHRGFLTLLRELAERWQKDPAATTQSAAALAAAVRAEVEGAPPSPPSQSPPLDRRPIVAAVAGLGQAFDEDNGGLRRAPKFPSNLPVRLLLRHHRRSGDTSALHMATRSLEKMAAGGIYDQLGGGFHRYSTDAYWRVPHFEKMLYDNALLAAAYLEAYQATGRADFARVAGETLDYALRDLASPEGGFYSASDADSEGEEGKYFLWSKAEIDALLGTEAERFERYYGVTAGGDLDGKAILHVPHVDEGEWAALAGARARLRAARARRVPPDRDEKVLCGWNGLLVSALANGGRILGEPRYLDAARSAASFVLQRMRRDGHLLRSYSRGHAGFAATLDDYAFFVAGLLDLYEATFEPAWLREAIARATEMDDRFADRARGGWYQTASDHEPLLARLKPDQDGAEPAGSSVALLDVLRLAAFTDDPRWQESAERAFAAYGADLSARPLAHTEMLLALDWATDTPKEVILVWPKDAPPPQPLLTVLRTTYLPNRILGGAAEGPRLDELGHLVPLAEGKRALGERPTAYVCEDHACRFPTADPTRFGEQLRALPAH